MYPGDTNMSFTACSVPELQHDINMDLLFLQIDYAWIVKDRIYASRVKAKKSDSWPLNKRNFVTSE